MPTHYHHHRSEHWTIMNGEAEVMLGDDVLVVSPDDSLYVPAGVVHGVKAGADGIVELVAVHFGDTVSDDDDMISPPPEPWRQAGLTLAWRPRFSRLR
jgi:mannose-6-phosphate isomerase-like protein (cupin superfamily)